MSIAQKKDFIEVVEKVSFNSDRKQTVVDRSSQNIDSNYEYKEPETIQEEFEEMEREESIRNIDTEQFDNSDT